MTILRDITVPALRVPMMMSFVFLNKSSLKRLGLPDRFAREFSFMSLIFDFQELTEVRFRSYFGYILEYLLSAAFVPLSAAYLPASIFTFLEQLDNFFFA